MLDAHSFFDLSDFADRAVFENTDRVWDCLANLKTYLPVIKVQFDSGLSNGVPLRDHLVLYEDVLIEGGDCRIRFGDTGRGGLEVFRAGEQLPGASVIMAGAVLMGEGIVLGKGVLVESGALIKGPTVIGDSTEVRQGAYLRGFCLVGQRCVVGHTTEVKNSIFLNDAKAGHFAYVGDSILGNGVNLGAGTKLANFRFIPGEVRVKTVDGYIDSGLRKFGAVLGDNVQTGCNTVTSPGTIVGPDGLIMPNTTVPSGCHAPRSVIR